MPWQAAGWEAVGCVRARCLCGCLLLLLVSVLLLCGRIGGRERTASQAGGQPRREGLPGGLSICPLPETQNYESAPVLK